jgi:hypothetical protein
MTFIRRHWFALLVIAAALARVPRVFAWWYDEAFTDWLTHLPFAAMIQATRGDVHPPLFYTMEWLVAHIPGATPTALRILPAAASLASLILARRIAQRLRLPAAAQAVGLTIMAISGWQIYYSQEARSYSFIMLWFLVGVLAALNRRWVWLFVAFTASLYTHSYGLIYSATVGLFALINEMRFPVHARPDPEFGFTESRECNWKAPVIAGAGALALYAPWFVYATLGQLAEFKDHWIWPPTTADVITTYIGFLFGQVTPVFWTLLAALAGAGVMLFVAYRIIADRHSLTVRALAYLAVFPVVLAIVGSYTFSPLYLYRALIGVSVPYYLLIGWALTERVSPLARAWAGALLIPIIAISSAGDLMRQRQTSQFSPAAVTAVIDSGWKPGDIVYHVSLYSRVEMEQWLGQRAGYLMPALKPGLDKGGLTQLTRTAMGFPAFQMPLDSIKFGRAWLIVINGPGLDMTPERDELLAGHPYQLVFSARDAMQQHTVEVYLLWPRQPSASH